MRVEVIVLVIYFIGMIGIGLYWNRKAKKSEDYLLGGRSMGPFITALTLQTTAMSGYMFMGGPAYAYSVGWFALFYAFGDAGGGIINSTVLARRMRRLSQIMDCISPIEYLEKRYESIGVKVIASVIAIFGLSGYILAQFLATGTTLVTLFNFPFATGLFIGVCVILFYTFVGGYFAVAYTDVVQGIIMISAVMGVLILSLVKIGGLGALNRSLAEIDPTYLSIWGKDLQYQGAWGVIAGAVLIYFIGYLGLPHMVIKYMALNSPKEAKSTLIYATIWNQLFIFSPYILGIIGIVLLPGLEGSDAEKIIPSLAFMLFPGAIAAIVLTAIMSAIMSTVAALMLLTGTILSVDIYKRWLNPNATDKQLLIASRGMICAIAVVGLTIAILQPPGVFGLVIFSFGVMSCAFLPSYFCAVFWKKANATGSMVSMVLGGGTNVIWTAFELEGATAMHPFFIGLIVSVIAMIICSNFGKPTSPKMIENMERAKGTPMVSPKLEGAASKTLVSEGSAVSKYMVSNGYIEERGFSLA